MRGDVREVIQGFHVSLPLAHYVHLEVAHATRLLCRQIQLHLQVPHVLFIAEPGSLEDLGNGPFLSLSLMNQSPSLVQLSLIVGFGRAQTFTLVVSLHVRTGYGVEGGAARVPLDKFVVPDFLGTLSTAFLDYR